MAKKTEQINKDSKKPYSVRSKFTDFTPTEWKRNTRSWQTITAREPEWKVKKQHPGTYPHTLPGHFILMFTKAGDLVLDPMIGSGSTAVAAAMHGRNCIGFDLNIEILELGMEILDEYYARQVEEVSIILESGDAIAKLQSQQTESVDFVMFSPPYADAMHRSRGGTETRHKQRVRDGLPTLYSDSDRDVGNFPPRQWLAWMRDLMDALHRPLKTNRYCAVVLQNLVGKQFIPLAWDFGHMMCDFPGWEVKGEVIWTQDSKPLNLAGWPSNWLPSNHHHTVIILRKVDLVE